MLEAYRQHVEERAVEGVPPKPLTAEQTAELVDLLKNPPAGEEQFLLELITDRVPPGVDEAAYVKAAFLTAISKGEATSPLIDKVHAVKLLGTMQGGYNIVTLVELLDDDALAQEVGEQLKHTLLASMMLPNAPKPAMPWPRTYCSPGPRPSGSWPSPSWKRRSR